MKSLLTPLMLGLLALPVAAQTADKPAPKKDAEARLAEAERRLDILSRELEAQRLGSVMPAAKEQGQFGLAPAASKVYDSKGGLSIGGYGEFLYQSYDNTLQDGSYAPQAANLDALRFVLYTGYKFNENIVFNAELEWEHGGYSDESPEGEAIVEFAYLDFLIHPAFNVRAGQMLVPMGFTNELHEPPAFLGTNRPTVERNIIPTTWHENGVGIHGELPMNVSYRVYLMNGFNANGFSEGGIRGGRQFGKEATAEHLAVTGRVDWNPMAGTLVGFGFYTGNSQQALGLEAIRTNLMEVHAEWRGFGFQVRGLYAQSRNGRAGVESLALADPAREVGIKGFGGYLEAGYDVFQGRFGKQSLTPYVRWERLNTQQDVAAGVTANPANDQTILTTGVSWKPIPQVALKADLNRIENRARTGQDQFNIALGFYF